MVVSGTPPYHLPFSKRLGQSTFLTFFFMMHGWVFIAFYSFYTQWRVIAVLRIYSFQLRLMLIQLKREIFMANINILHLHTQIMIHIMYDWIHNGYNSNLGTCRLLLPELLNIAWPPRGVSFTTQVIPHSSHNPWWLDSPCVSHVSHLHPAIPHELIPRLLPIWESKSPPKLLSAFYQA